MWTASIAAAWGDGKGSAQPPSMPVQPVALAAMPRVLGIDEHFFTRKKGFATTLCDLHRHRVYDVVLGRSELSLAGRQNRGACGVHGSGHQLPLSGVAALSQRAH